MAKNLKEIYVGVDKSNEDRRSNDLYETPPLATYILCKYSDVPENVIEPCAGRGNISIELKRNGHNVKSYDLNSYSDNLINDIIIGQNVLDLKKEIGYDALITNPPYFKDLPRQIAEKGIKEYPYTALFVRATFLEGVKRKEMFCENPPSQLIFFSDRIRFKENMTEEPVDFAEQAGGMIFYIWIVWDKKANHKNTKLNWVSLKEEYKEWREKYETSIS